VIVSLPLGALLPAPRESALLRACLLDGPDARAAWREWLAAGPVPVEAQRRELARARTLLPLLARSAERNDLPLDPGISDYARAATLREELRAERYLALAAGALRALREAGVTTMVVRGAALAATVYERWSLRHCHDLDLLVPASEHPAALRALARAGFRTIAAADGTRAEHDAGMQVALHERPFVAAWYAASPDTFARRSRTLLVGGVAADVPSSEAMLVHVLGHASCASSNRNLRWVADAWHVIARSESLDWDDVVQLTCAHRLELPLATMLDYLATLASPVPATVLNLLRARATAANGAAEDAALGGMAAAAQGDLRRIWRCCHSSADRRRLLRWAVAPSTGYLRSAFGIRRRWLLPLMYLYRPLRFGYGRVRARAGG
jgi:hypothetical protein